MTPCVLSTHAGVTNVPVMYEQPSNELLIKFYRYSVTSSVAGAPSIQIGEVLPRRHYT